jgi:isochorismate synthase
VTLEPSFVLAGPDGVVVADGVHTAFPRIADAQAALATGSAPIIVGALPFDTSAAAALMRPKAVRFAGDPPNQTPVVPASLAPTWSALPLPAVHIREMVPAPDVHRARVKATVEQLTNPDTGLHKVVLARCLRLQADAPLDVSTLLARLASADPTATTYLADLTAAGGDYVGKALVGASPELLVERRGERVICRPFAGSTARSADPDTDRANSAALAASSKNRHEHELVVAAMRAALGPLCSDVTIAAEPQLSRTAAVWHLSTPITGRLRDSATTALDLAVALHPTPAVGGVPAGAAARLINELEGDRGFYAGAVGWCDERGDGRWFVSIRCAQLSADRRNADAHAGGGIVAGSDPDDEVDETTSKFATILRALGVQP